MMPMKTAKTPRKMGRPTRAQAAMKMMEKLGIDPLDTDPRTILQAIARDLAAPHMARVAACKALLTFAEGTGAAGKAKKNDPERLSNRAVQLLAIRGGKS
jgi:hypothetical protein